MAALLAIKANKKTKGKSLFSLIHGVCTSNGIGMWSSKWKSTNWQINGKYISISRHGRHEWEYKTLARTLNFT